MIARTLAMAIGLIGAIVFSQLPEFAQQYRQRIGGALDEVARIVARFESDARQAGLDATQAIARLRGSPDVLAQRRGDAAAADRGRREALDSQRRGMASAGAFGRVAQLAAWPDSALMQATWADFEPAVPVTFEGFVFAAAGFFLGWLGVRGPAAGWRRYRERRRRVTPAPARF